MRSTTTMLRFLLALLYTVAPGCSGKGGGLDATSSTGSEKSQPPPPPAPAALTAKPADIFRPDCVERGCAPYYPDGCPGADRCIVVGCGSGDCVTCLPQFSNLVVGLWCSYSCFAEHSPAGGAYYLVSAIGKREIIRQECTK